MRHSDMTHMTVSVRFLKACTRQPCQGLHGLANSDARLEPQSTSDARGGGNTCCLTA